MAIAASSEEACALWQADLQAALDKGRYSLEDSDGELLRYVVRDTNRVIDAQAYSNDPNAPDGQAVMAAAEVSCGLELESCLPAGHYPRCRCKSHAG